MSYLYKVVTTTPSGYLSGADVYPVDGPGDPTTSSTRV